jgi:Rrf2 family protein
MANLVKISEAASLGLHAMMVLARELQPKYSAVDLSKELKVSEAHLAKVMQRLAKEGLVKSTRGPKGGFTLGRPADTISFLQIYEAIEGPLTPAGCLLSAQVCKNGHCIFGDLITTINRQISERLATTMLSSQQ